jgi:tripartite-type tricarboxylate transporter receptor subunit TctC
MRRRSFIAGSAAAAFAAPGISTTFAQAYPEKPIRIVVPNPPGGSADYIGRFFQTPLQRILGQPVAVANVVGGGTSIGNRQVRDAAPDGHTVLAVHQALLTAAALKVMDFGPEAYQKVAQVAAEYVTVVVNRKAPYQDLKSFLAAAKAGDLRAGVQIGAINHFLFLSLGDKTNTKFRYVNTGGGGPTRTALAGGHVDCAFLTVNEAKPLVDSGDLTIVAIFAPERLPSWPNLATAREQGADLLLNLNYWWWMPKATPAARVDRFAEALREAMKDPEVIQKFAEFNMSPAFLKGAELEAEINRQYEEMKALAARNNVTAG